MLLAWRDPALERACSSGDAIELRWPHSVEAVKRLLWTVKHCCDLGALLMHPAVTTALAGEHAEAPLSIQMRRTRMQAAALTRTGEIVGIRGTDELLEHSTTTALLVADLTAEGPSSRLRKAS